MKTEKKFLGFLLLIMVLSSASLFGQDGQGKRLAGLMPEVLNASHPDQSTSIGVGDEVMVRWVANPTAKSQIKMEDIQRIEAGEIDLLIQFELGAPHKLATLNAGNNPRELSCCLRIQDFEYLLAGLDLPTYGKIFKSGTKCYLHFKDVKVVSQAGTKIELNLSDRESFVGFVLN